MRITVSGGAIGLGELLELMPDASVAVDAEGRIVAANSALSNLLGYDAEELAGKPIELLVPELLRARHAAKRRDFARRPERRSMAPDRQLVARHRNGGVIDVLVSLQPVPTAEGPVVVAALRDITALRQAEVAFRESEAKYRALVENMADGLLVADRNDIVRFVNPQACRMLGYSEAELLGQDVARLLMREADRAAMVERNRRRAAGIAEGYEIEVRKKSGELLWTSFSVAPVTDVEGRFSGSMAIIADIAERKRSEAALRSSEIQLRTFIEHAPVEIAMFDNDMICLAASRRWIDVYGRERPTPVGISHYVVHPDLPERWKEVHRRALAGEAQACEDDLWIQADGTRQWQRWSVDPWRNTKGAIGGLIMFTEDITGRKEAQEAILAEKAFSEAMLDSLPGVFYLFDQTGRFLRWNRALEAVSEYSATEIAAMSPLDFFTGEESERIAESVRKVFESGHAEVEVALTSKSGREIPHYFVGTRVNWSGAPCCIGTGIDVTARKLLEAELQQAQKIEAIGRLAGGVAHDFNNILGVILGYGELAESELAPGSPAREQVAEMVQAAQRAADLTRQLQAFSRKQVLQPRRLDLNELVANAHKMLARLIGEDIAVVVRQAPELGTVRADPGQIDQILLNLAVNARDAMPEGGTLTLETADVDLREDDAAIGRPTIRPGRYVMLAVSDTGVGMDAETQRRLFEPFFTTKPAGKGTGLGLATVYGIVKQSGGYIWVYSELGLGTSFKIYLPRVDELPEGTAPVDSLASTGGGSETILLVEDNLALREMIRRRLVGRGYTVLLAGDGEEALALSGARDEPIDLVLTDVVMPNLGGAALARRLGALRPGLRVLFMSGYTDGAIVQQGVLEEGVVLLEKPFSGERLERMVREVLDRPRPG